MKEIVSNFCKSTDTLKRLDDYYPNVKLSEEEKTQFAFLALNKLLDDPQWPDLTYGWKISRILILIEYRWSTYLSYLKLYVAELPCLMRI